MNDENRREHLRRPITHTAYIVTGLGPPLKCTMRDVSESGGRIAVGDPRSSPQEFLLMLNQGLLRWCRVIWRSEKEVGIQFIRPPRSLKKKEDTAAKGRN